ncbi:MAG: ATP-binding protein [Planctomycetota bacterium]
MAKHARPKPKQGGLGQPLGVEKVPYPPPTGPPGCDELSYLSLGQQGAYVFFLLISQKSQRNATVMIADLPFADGRKICGLTPVAIAIADRLVYSSEVLTLGGTRYRGRLIQHRLYN